MKTGLSNQAAAYMRGIRWYVLTLKEKREIDRDIEEMERLGKKLNVTFMLPQERDASS